MPSKEAEAVASGDAGSPRIGNSGLVEYIAARKPH